VLVLPYRQAVSLIRFSPDGGFLTTLGEGNQVVRLWHPGHGGELAQLRHDVPVRELLSSPDGSALLAYGSHDASPSLWRTKTGSRVARIRMDNPVSLMAFSPDSRWFMGIGQDQTLRLWRTATGREQPLHTRARMADAVAGRQRSWAKHMTEWSAAFSPDSSSLATASTDHMVRVWDLASGQETARMSHGDPPMMITFSPGGTRLITVGVRALVRVWNPATGTETARLTHHSPITMTAFNPSGTRLVTCCADRTIRLWNLANGVEISRMRYGEIFMLSPDLTQLATGSGRSVQLLELTTGATLARLQHEHEVQAVEFDPEGARLATRDGKNVTLWAT
jgi:WD40 repeat protein